jgi:dipeptidyl aminopeptidase/acylaminoacyl peptidase
MLWMALNLAFAEGWQQPPDPISDLLDRTPPPSTWLTPDHEWIVELSKPGMPDIAELARPVERLAGRKIDPQRFGPARAGHFTGMSLVPVGKGEPVAVELPEGFRFRSMRWSPSGERAFFTEIGENGYSLWVMELETGEARQISERRLNATYGNPCDWVGEEKILCKTVPSDIGDPPPPPPPGPRVEENEGEIRPARTYTNLLQNQHDIERFEHYFSSELTVFGLDGKEDTLLDGQIIDEASVSPSGLYVLVESIHAPYSTSLPLYRFPKRSFVLNPQGKEVLEVADLPLADRINTAFNSVREGRRNIAWRPDKPATLWWVVAKDGGDARAEADVRDAVYLHQAPFIDSPRLLTETELRFYSIDWGNGEAAILYEYWYDSRTMREWRIAPDDPKMVPYLLGERDYQDAYSDPGRPMKCRNQYGLMTLCFSADGRHVYRSGRGASPEGLYPFLDKHHIWTNDSSRVWQAAGSVFEEVVDLLDNQASQFITRRQSALQPRNLYLRKSGKRWAKPLTEYTDHMPEMAGIQKELLQYAREDGVELSATVFLPAGHRQGTDSPLPTLIWAYPQEFKSSDSAGQVRTSKHTFVRPSYSSVLFLLTQGYAVVLNPTIPIIGEGENEPNDEYVDQLVSGAEAVVMHLAKLGISDPDRMAIGGHSYGAFTAANLLAHTDLFRAGIARSGAYNRSLTPFGFQSEQRSFWEAPEVYFTMSPFMQASKIDEPLLMLHGADDPNSGTYPMQSKRMYEALQGLGATVRWVELPHEEHGYRSREAVGHVHYEMVQWLDKHVKNAEADPSE